MFISTDDVGLIAPVAMLLPSPDAKSTMESHGNEDHLSLIHDLPWSRDNIGRSTRPRERALPRKYIRSRMTSTNLTDLHQGQLHQLHRRAIARWIRHLSDGWYNAVFILARVE